MKSMWILVIAGAGALQWLICAGRSAFSGEAFPKQGIRTSERLLLGSTLVFLLALAPAIDPKALWTGTTNTTAASALRSGPMTSCAAIEVGMKASEVQSRMGPPDETRSDAEIRGPGSSILIYKDSRCGVHLFDGRVEFVD